MKVIYIAGKYFGETSHEIFTNIQVARVEAEFVWARGGIALCPHLNTSWMSGICPEENFLNGYLQLLTLCDAVYTCWNWRISTGATAEVDKAKELGIPVFHNRSQVMEFLVP